MIVAFDTETELITDTCLAPRLVCVQYQIADAPPEIVLWRDAYALVRSWLEHDTLVGHHTPYDLGVVCAQWLDLIPLVFIALDECRIRDTLTRQKLIDIGIGEFRGYHTPDGAYHRRTYHLADLAKRHCGIEMRKGADTWRLWYGELRDIPLASWPRDAIDYALLDATITYRSHEAQEQSHPALLVDQDAQVRAGWWLQLASAWGMHVDAASVARLEAEVRGEYDSLRDYLIDCGLVRTTTKGPVRNTKVAAARMVEVCTERGELVKQTAKGGVCLNAEACEDSQDPVLEAYAEYSAWGNVLAKDLPALRSGEIHGRFESLVASGRTACRGFNLQNLRREGGTRECFTPRDGFDLCMIDLDTAELRAVAQVCLNLGLGSRMANEINAGRDVHCILASEITGAAYETVHAGKDEDPWKGERQLAKHANFGLWGGMGLRRFQALIKHMTGRVLEPAHVKWIRDSWLRAWPEAGAYLDYHARLCASGPAYVEQEYSHRIRGGLRYSEACNTRFQGLIADAMKAAGYELAREMYTGGSILSGSRIINFPHDEFIAEVPSHIGHECAMRIHEIVITVVGRYLPDVPPTATPCLARRWSKHAKPIWVDGRLVPWSG
jgi:hypothetical protein